MRRSRIVRALLAAVVLGAAASALAACANVLALDEYGASGSGSCAPSGCLACLVSKCSASVTHQQLGADPMHQDYSGAACPSYPECVCNCTDTSCADSCANATVTSCPSFLGTFTAACPGIADCPCQ
jgi:Tfp pilus assembly protein PilV